MAGLEMVDGNSAEIAEPAEGGGGDELLGSGGKSGEEVVAAGLGELAENVVDEVEGGAPVGVRGAGWRCRGGGLAWSRDRRRWGRRAAQASGGALRVDVVERGSFCTAAASW